MNLSKLASGLLPALLLGCGVASASTIKVSGVDETRGAKDMVISENGGDVQLYFAGVISIEVTEGGKTFTRDSLCVDLFTDIIVGQPYTTNLLQPIMVPSKNLTRVSWLVENYFPTAPGSDSATLIAQGEGIQLAIWDIVHDGGDGLTTGSVQKANTTPQAVVDWAVIYENASVGKSDNQAFVYNNVGSDGVAQMLIGPQFADGPQPVPEPQTLMPMGIALIALSLGLRRGIRKHQ
jgi:hypothetical protein